jgi:SAM-dependent methyltransferase
VRSGARDALGRHYERTLAPPTRKARGAFYTPAFLVDYLVRHTLGPALDGNSPADVRDFRIFDPACGSGAFLLGAFDHLLAWYGPSADPLTILRRHLFGTDTDAEALAVAERSLLQRAGAPPRTSLAKNLCVADALTDSLPACDVILANPPYLNGVEGATRVPPDVSHALRSRYRCASGTIDRSILFQELCLRLLRPGGRCGLVVPNKFCSAPFGRAFRAFAAEEAGLELLADFSAAEVFDGASVYPVAYVLRRGSDEPARTIVHVFDRAGARRGEPIRAETVHVGPRDVATWDQLLSPDLPLLQRLARDFRPLGQDYEVAASATAAEAYGLLDHLTNDTPTAGGYRFITSGLIDRYADHHGRRPVRYLKRDFAAPWLPRDCAALSPNRRRQYASEKLLLAGMARELEVVWDDGQLAGAVATVQVLRREGSPMPLKAVLAILNSSLIARWFRQTYHSLSLAGGYMRIGCPQVAAVPLLPRTVHERHGRLVAELAAAGEARMRWEERLDAAIDELTREWYGLELRSPSDAARKRVG